MKNWLTIGEMNEKTGLSHKALRLYEQKGLLIPHNRSESNYRYYHEKQLTQAFRIVELKGLGFHLDEIKFILQNTNELNLKFMVECKIKTYENQLIQTSQVILQLKNILSSLENHQVLNQEQRGQIMENLFEKTKKQLNRKGIPVKGEILDRLNSELHYLPTELKSVLNDFIEIIEYAKKNKILIGPGRGSSAGSLIMYAMGYIPTNPVKYGLVPELFVQTKNIWIEVEYSNYSEIGKMCDELSRKHQFEVVAFRAPYLDIFKKMQDQFGQVEFNEISDFDPMILCAPNNLDFEGLWDFDWDNRFHAFKSSSKEFQSLYDVDSTFVRSLVQKYPLKSPDEMMLMSVITYFRTPQEVLQFYSSENMTSIPELDDTRGEIIFHEDWVKIASQYLKIDTYYANQLRKRIAKNQLDQSEIEFLDLIENQNLVQLLKQSAKSTFSKAHMVSAWWIYKRTAILKSLWPVEYVQCIHDWEEKNQIIWQEFGYKTDQNEFYLKA